MNIIRKNYIIICCLVSIIAGLAFILYWLKPSVQSNRLLFSSSQHQNNISIPPISHNQNTTAKQFGSASQADIQINCQLQFHSNSTLIVNEQTRNCFEYFISQYGEHNIQDIQQRIAAYIQQQFPASHATQILDLWSRYLKYRIKISQIDVAQHDPDSLDYLKTIFQAYKNLRATLFSSVEIDGLFGQENIYDEYTINRTAVLQDPSLNEAAKAKQLNILLKNLPTDLQQQLEQFNTLENLRQLSADIKARRGSPAELHQMRINLVGEVATQRLEQLDQQRLDWKAQVNQYLNQRDDILQSGLSDHAKQQAIVQLRNRQFTSPEQQLRLNTFEQQHDKGGTLPFADTL